MRALQAEVCGPAHASAGSAPWTGAGSEAVATRAVVDRFLLTDTVWESRVVSHRHYRVMSWLDLGARIRAYENFLLPGR